MSKVICFNCSCFERALTVADDNIIGEVWYNISHIAIGLGDFNLAYQALKITLSYDPHHFEALNNIGVLEQKKGNHEQAKSNFKLSCMNTDFSFEPFYNYSVLRFKEGELEDSLKFNKKSIEIFPTHFESLELQKHLLEKLFK